MLGSSVIFFYSFSKIKKKDEKKGLDSFFYFVHLQSSAWVVDFSNFDMLLAS